MAELLLGNGFRLALVAAHDDGDALRVVYLFLAGWPDRRVELECVVPEDDPALRSLAYLSFSAGRFEREMADLYGIRPVGHPKARRLVRHAHWPEDWYPMRGNAGPAPEFEDCRPFPVHHGRGARGLRDPGRAGARRADRTRPLPLLRRRRNRAAAQGPAVVRPPGSGKALRGPPG